MIRTKTYGIQASDGRWLQWLTLDGRRGESAAIGWVSGLEQVAWRGSEREAKAIAALVPAGPEHPLRVR